MDRRKAMKLTAGVIAGSGIGLVTLANAFKNKNELVAETKKLEYSPSGSSWQYSQLDPEVTGGIAYEKYSEGSCMYATIVSVITQLANKYGEPFASFPSQMFKYGHGGVGGYGTVCGALNGAAALIGLFIADKSVQDRMISDIFQWYEKAPLPEFVPINPVFDFSPPSSVSNSVLCHASNTNWVNSAGFKIDSNERKERCRRLTCDVAKKLTSSLNEVFSNIYMTNINNNEVVNSCIVCHGNEGKLNNASSSMSCNSCHTESVGHRVFSDVHYKLMKE